MINLQKPSILLSIKDAMLSLTHPTIIFHMLWPIILGFLLWVVFYIGLWYVIEPIILPYTKEIQQDLPQWLVRIGIASIFVFILQALLAILLMPVIYLTFVIIISVFSIPLTMPTIVKNYYPNIKSREVSGFITSLKVTAIASGVFLFFYVASFSLFFLPFAIVIAHLICTAFLNKATFLFDALANHATEEEFIQIREQFAKPLFLLGLLNAFLTYIPLVNLFAPAIAALCFIHFGLSALEFIRQTPEDNEDNKEDEQFNESDEPLLLAEIKN